MDFKQPERETWLFVIIFFNSGKKSHTSITEVSRGAITRLDATDASQCLGGLTGPWGTLLQPPAQNLTVLQPITSCITPDLPQSKAAALHFQDGPHLQHRQHRQLVPGGQILSKVTARKPAEAAGVCASGHGKPCRRCCLQHSWAHRTSNASSRLKSALRKRQVRENV